MKSNLNENYQVLTPLFAVKTVDSSEVFFSVRHSHCVFKFRFNSIRKWSEFGSLFSFAAFKMNFLWEFNANEFY